MGVWGGHGEPSGRDAGDVGGVAGCFFSHEKHKKAHKVEKEPRMDANGRESEDACLLTGLQD